MRIGQQPIDTAAAEATPSVTLTDNVHVDRLNDSRRRSRPPYLRPRAVSTDLVRLIAWTRVRSLVVVAAHPVGEATSYTVDYRAEISRRCPRSFAVRSLCS